MQHTGNITSATKRLALRTISLIDRVLGPKLRLVTAIDFARGPADSHYERIAAVVEERTAGVVASGPFAGMTLVDRGSWGTGERAAKLLGCYEQELHDTIEEFVSVQPTCIINVGCAEGYYAVGLAKRLPAGRVAAVDISAAGLEICDHNAAANEVSEQIFTMLPDGLDADWTSAAGSLWVVDVEGAELEILDPSSTPSLRSAMVLVECHDFVDPHITEELRSRFSATHMIRDITQSGRNPGSYAALRDRPEAERWAAVNEHRPCVMNWLAMTPRS